MTIIFIIFMRELTGGFGWDRKMQPGLKRLYIKFFRGYVAVRKALFFPLILGCFLLIGQTFQETMKIPQPSKFIEESKQFTKLVEKIYEGIVFCYSGDTTTTGFFISDDGWIITAGHKVNPDFPSVNKIFIKLERLADSKIFESQKIVAPVPGLDLLIFKIDYTPQYYFKTFKLPYLFEENWVFGFKSNSGKTISSPGYVSYWLADSKLLLTSASVFFGNSGSPVINRKGEVLGVLIKMTRSLDGLFIPGSVVEKYIKDTMAKLEKENAEK